MPAALTLPMLKEWDVILAVHDFLKGWGWELFRCRKETERGDDITGRRYDGKFFCIEAKGETSSKESNRAGKQFTSAQVTCHVSMAFARAASRVDERMLSAVAFPDNEDHRRYVKRLASPCQKLGITVFWVTRNKVVKVNDYGRWHFPGALYYL